MATDWEKELLAKSSTAGNGRDVERDEITIDDALAIVEEARREARREAIEECAKLVSLASVKHPSCIDGIGGLKWKQYNETAKMMAHAVCQSLASELRAVAALKKARGGK